MSKTNIILASASIGRKQLLEKLGVPFTVQISDIDEDIIIHHNPFKMLQMRSQAKGENVAQKLTADSSQPTEIHKSLIVNRKSFLIIAADSMAVLGNKTFGKAKNKVHAKEIVTELMGKTHIFATATSIIYLKYLKELKSLKEIQRWENLTKTSVTLRSLDASSLDAYISRYDFSRFAAGYALNETPWDLVTKIDGSYTNVVGLPFEVILPIFKSLKLLK